MFKNILKSPSIRKMATGIASVAGAVIALVASSGVVSAETNLNVSRPVDPNGVQAGPVTIEVNEDYHFKYSINGNMGPNGKGYSDYMRPIRVAGELVYCVEPHVVLQGGETVTRAIPLTQGVTLRKPGGTYTISGSNLVGAGFINWFMYNATDTQINQVVKAALHSGEGDQMRRIRDGVRARIGQNADKSVFLMQQYYWWGASEGAIHIEGVEGTADKMVDYYNELIIDKFAIPGAVVAQGRANASALNWMVRLRNLYRNNESAAKYNNDGYILETSGNSQRLFSSATFTPNLDVTPPPVKPENPLSVRLQKKSTLTAEEIAKSNGKYSLKGAQYGLFSSESIVGSPTGDKVKDGAKPTFTLTTDEQGSAKLDYIQKGTWYLKELKAPEGHELDNNTYKLTIQEDQPEVNKSNEYEIPSKFTTDKAKAEAPKPVISTVLKDENNSKTVDAGEVTLVDTISYENLTVGQEYTVSGRLMDKDSNKELNPAVTATAKFTPTSAKGTVDVKFTVDASKLGGKKLVAFESVSQNGKVVASHEDINDEGQTITILKPTPPAPPAASPEITTTLKGDQGSKEVEPKQVTLVDTISYTNLKVGKEYVVSGRLMDKETGKELNPAVTSTMKFTPTETDGTVDVKFTVDASNLGGKKLVAFESVSQNGEVVASHEDINDEGQTVTVKRPNPTIGTTLTDEKGAKEVEPNKVILVDAVKYTNLIVGKEYTVSGSLMDKETGKELDPAVTATTTFTATKANGSVDIKFTLDASRLGGKKVVAFEKMSQDGKVVASHEDINDEAQTVTIKKLNPSIGTTLKDNQGSKEVEPTKVTLVDTITYTNLIAGDEYEVTGRLMDRETGKELSPEVTATTKFTATKSNGTVDVTFEVDASTLQGKKLVAFEKVSQNGQLIASHEDINDEGQTVMVKTPNPEIGTTLKDENGSKDVEPTKVTLIDTVKYTNLIVGKEYTVSGRLMDKETGKELDPAVTATETFVAKESNGSIDIKFNLDASKLAGKQVVAFEKVSQDGKLVASHEDINDENQTVRVKSPNPSIGTTLTDEQGVKEVEPTKVTLVDKVSYENLTVGKEYTVSGRIMDKETGKELDPAVTGSTKFTPTESKGTVDVKFEFDASMLAGKKVVAFEKVMDGEKEVAVHEDINDEGQTVTVKTPNPEIGTTLTDDKGSKEVEPTKVTLIDTVKYTNLIVGKEYTVSGRFMDKETGKELEPAVTGLTKFTPTESNGTVDVKFELDASTLAGKKVVAFEKVMDGEKEVAVHEDINDEGQTVSIKKLTPEIGTTLINKATGDHKANPDKEVTLVDTVKYKNLEVGKEYEVTGRLMDKATGKEFEPSVKATAKFTPTSSEGSVDVTFTFDASALAGRSVVAFEVVTLDGQVVATHEDINDEGQTVEFTTPEAPKPSESKEELKTKVTPKTGVKGMNYGLVALVGVTLAIVAGTAIIISLKKSHK